MRRFALMCMALFLFCPVALAADNSVQPPADSAAPARPVAAAQPIVAPAVPPQPLAAPAPVSVQPPAVTGAAAPVAAPAVPTVSSTATPETPEIAVPSSQTAALLARMQSGSLTGYFEALGVLFLALAILWALAWFFRRRGGGFGSGHSTMRLIGRLSLGPKKWLVVADVYGKRMALGITDQQVTFLAELDTPEERGALPGQPWADAPVSKKDAEDFASLLVMEKPGKH